MGNDSATCDKFRVFLSKSGHRVTGQRLAIFEAAMERKEHFTAEDLLDFAREIDGTVSRATIYRTLPIMVKGAFVREVDIGKDLKFYLPSAGGATQVAQVICLDCDRIFEVSAPFLEWYGSTISAKLGHTAVSQRLQVSARCETLRKTGVCERRSKKGRGAGTLG